MYRVFFKKSAEKELSRLPGPFIFRIKHLTDQLQANPILASTKKSTGFKNAYRIRFGDYRVIYLLDKLKRSVVIVKIGHRREVYRR